MAAEIAVPAAVRVRSAIVRVASLFVERGRPHVRPKLKGRSIGHRSALLDASMRSTRLNREQEADQHRDDARFRH
jgi:hypothetical protein